MPNTFADELALPRYASMTDAEAADDLNDLRLTRDRISMSASEVLNAVDTTEFNALDAAGKQMVWDVLHIGEINPFGVEAALFVSVFGGTSASITALKAARVAPISRAQELGLGVVKVGHVQAARA